MESENFDQQPVPSEGAPTAPTGRGFVFPAQYYAAPPGDRRPLFAPWATTGCGIAALALLVLAFSAGYFASHGGMAGLMGWVFSQTQTEIVPMYTKDVTAVQKSQLDAEMKSLQKNVAAKRIPLDRVQLILRDMRDAMLDSKVTPEETNRLIGDLHSANTTAGIHSSP